jgi:hypothetical protein
MFGVHSAKMPKIGEVKANDVRSTVSEARCLSLRTIQIRSHRLEPSAIGPPSSLMLMRRTGCVTPSCRAFQHWSWAAPLQGQFGRAHRNGG